MNDKIVVKISKIEGKGVFATRDIKKGEIVLKWDTSKLLTKNEINSFPDEEKRYIIPFEDKYILIQEPERYVNHSCDSNTLAKDGCDIAIKDIKQGEEITANYFYQKSPFVNFKCNCGSSNCRNKKDNYYDTIVDSYNELYKEEQFEKVNIVKKYIDIKPDYKLLDVGCGNAFYLDDFNCSCTGIDPSEKMISLYKGKHEVFKGEAENIPFQAQEFDIVTSFTAIQNFHNIKKGLQEIKRVGNNIFALTFIKRSDNAEHTKSIIKSIFSDFNIKEIEHPKDVILIIKKI